MEKIIYRTEFTEEEKGIIIAGLDLLYHDDIEQAEQWRMVDDMEGFKEYWDQAKKIEKMRDYIRSCKIIEKE